MVYWDHQVVIFLLLWLCVYPSSVEVIEFWVYGYVSSAEVIVVVFLALSLYPSLCRGDCCFGIVPYLLCRGGCVGERSCVLLALYLQISQWMFPVWGSYVDIVKILLCEGGNVEWWLEPRIISCCLRLIHYLSTLFLISCIALYCSYHLYLGIVCVPILVLNQESFI